MQNLSQNKKIILFDGVCNLCNSSIQFVIKQDKKDVFRFGSLQSERGKNIISKIKEDNIDSFILYISDNEYYTKSSAAIEVVRNLGGFWKLFLIFKIIPTKFRDIIYDFVAKNRYRWFGKNDSCMIPTLEIQSKFLA